MTVKEKKNYKLGHPNKLLGQTEAFGDSDRGLLYFKKKHCTRVDGNALPARGGVPANVHYWLFLRHGFVRIDGKPTMKSLPVGHFSIKQLKEEFHTKRGHYRIDSSINRIKRAFELGMDYEFEIKAVFTKAEARRFWTQVLDLQMQYPGRKVIVKVYNNHPGKAMWLKPWHELGAPTLITTHNPFRRTDKAAEPYADEYRGFKPRWV